MGVLSDSFIVLGGDVKFLVDREVGVRGFKKSIHSLEERMKGKGMEDS